MLLPYFPSSLDGFWFNLRGLMRGQAFTTFKILIGAVFAVALLTIIYYIVPAYQYPYSGVEETRNLVIQAYRAPGKCFTREKIQFKQGEAFTQGAFDPITVKFESTNIVQEKISCSLTYCTVKQKITAPVSVNCTTNECKVCFGFPNCSTPSHCVP